MSPFFDAIFVPAVSGALAAAGALVSPGAMTDLSLGAGVAVDLLPSDGSAEGTIPGFVPAGVAVGPADGTTDGLTVGVADGAADGLAIGVAVGVWVGAALIVYITSITAPPIVTDALIVPVLVRSVAGFPSLV